MGEGLNQKTGVAHIKSLDFPSLFTDEKAEAQRLQGLTAGEALEFKLV